MSDQEIGKALMHVDTGASASAPDPRLLAGNILQRERWRVRLLTGLTVLLWLLAAAGVFFVIYVATWHLYPKQQQLMRDTTLGKLSVEKAVEIQAIHFQMVEICTRVVAAAFVALTLAALCTVLLVLASRRATLRQINASLAEISEQLKASQSPGPTPPRPGAAPS
jgi:phage shock protein PspC (stress-responsive transcriptional regulator)